MPNAKRQILNYGGGTELKAGQVRFSVGEIRNGPPLAPDGLNAIANGSGKIDLSWISRSASSTIYQIVRNGVVIGQTTAGATTFSDTTVSEATNYAYSVVAIVNGVSSAASGLAWATTPLATPSGLAANAVSATQIHLAWANPSQATNSFLIYRSTNGNAFSPFDPGSYAPLTQSPISGTSYADTTAIEGTHYWYQVQAVGSSDSSLYPSSLSAAADCWSLPAAPTDLAATEIDANRVKFSWTNQSQGATMFYLERLDPGSNSYVIIGTVDAVAGTNSFTDWSVDGSSTYGYLVVAATPDGNVSGLSDTCTTSVTTPVAGVINLSAAETSTTEIDLSYALGDADATEIHISYWTGTAAPTSVSGAPLDASLTPFAVTNLSPDTHYYFKICVVDSNRTTGYSVVDVYTLPNVPTGLSATAASSGEVDLGWLNNGDSSTVYDIKRFDPGAADYDLIGESLPGATTFKDLSVTDGDTYSYQANAESGDGAATTPASESASATVPLARPSDFTATTIGPNTVSFSWTNNSMSNTGYLLSFVDTADITNSYVVTLNADQTACSPDDLQPGTAYDFSIVATDNFGHASTAAQAQATTPDACFISVSGPGTVDEKVSYTLTATQTAARGYTDFHDGWRIDWGDGGPIDVSGSLTHIYSLAGSYTISATPTDHGAPLEAAQTQSVTVNAVVPTPSLELLDANGDVIDAGGTANSNGATVSLSASLILDGASHTSGYWVNWGDGNTLQEYGAEDSQFTHTYDTSFKFQYRISVSTMTSVGAVSWITTASINQNDQSGVTFPAIGYGSPGVSAGGGIGAGGTGSYYGYSSGRRAFDSDHVTYSSNDFGRGDTIEEYFGFGSQIFAGMNYPDFLLPLPTVYGINWGDGTTQSDVPNGTVLYHHYSACGVYPLTWSNRLVTLGERVTIIDTTPTLDPMPVEVVPAGKSVDLTEPFYNLNLDGISDPSALAQVDWGDGRGPQPAALDIYGNNGHGLYSGAITAHLDHAPVVAGVYTPTISVASPYGAYVLKRQSTLDVWSITIGNGKDTDVLAASADGRKNLQPLTLNFPGAEGEALNITITTTNATDNYVWTEEYPGVMATPVLGDGTSSYTFSTADLAGAPVFFVGATAGNTNYDCLSYSFAATIDFAATPSAPYGGYVYPPDESVPSNKASDIGMTFEAPMDGAGNTVLVKDNSPVPSTSPAATQVGPWVPVTTPPTPVDLLYPTNAPTGSTITILTEGSRLRLWDTSARNKLLLGGDANSWQFAIGASSPTTVYAQAVGESIADGNLETSMVFTPAVVAGAGQLAAAPAPATVGPWVAVVQSTITTVVIDPVTGDQAPTDLADINTPPSKFTDSIINPSVIVVGDPDHPARIQITPTSFIPAGATIDWKLDTGAAFTGAATITELFPNKAIEVVGTKAGPIRILVSLILKNGARLAVESYDALVSTLRVLPYRVQILVKPSSTPASLQVEATKDLALIATANRFLRELGVELRPDTSQQIFNNNPDFSATPAGVQGVFDVRVKPDSAASVLMISRGASDANLIKYIGQINDHAGVVQLIFDGKTSLQDADGEQKLNGEAVTAPNSKYNVNSKFQLTFRVGAKKEWITPTPGMNLLKSGNVAVGVWGAYLFSGAPGTTIAHEMGHVMGLAHRFSEAKPGDPGDGIFQAPQLANNNVMSYGSNNRGDFDLIQAMAIQGSSAFLPGT